ncbi:MAG: MFS transporter [Pseudomonadota bacterium]
MSTIVVVQKGHDACIAADSLTSFGDQTLGAHYDRHSDKIQKIHNSYFGIVGSAAHSLVVESALKRAGTTARLNSRVEIFQTLIKLHKSLKEDYFLNPSESEEDPYESIRFDAVLANAHGIFGVYSLREVYEYQRFWAIGAGADYALGAMHALYDRLESAEDIARAAIEASAEFNNATALPMTLQTVKVLEKS